MLRTIPHLIKTDMITLATDDYRGIYLPEAKAHEQLETRQVFTRTQDTAYLVKELVMSRLKKLENEARPNILFDGVTYERSLNALIEPSKVNFRSMVACLPESREAPRRAFSRALTASDLADKGRFINVISLITGHKETAGCDLIDGVPVNAPVTLLINTFVPTGTPLKQFGSIFHEKNSAGRVVATVRITDVKTASDYFGKQNLNPVAQMKHDMYSFFQVEPRDTFKYNHYHKARSLLSLVSTFNPKETWRKIKHLEFGDPPYVRIKLNQDSLSQVNTFDIEVLNEKHFEKALNSNNKSPAAFIFREIMMQARMYNEMQTEKSFTEQSVNERILQERHILGVKNLQTKHLP